MTPVFIYTLNDPTTGVVRYYGQTVDPDVRLVRHVRHSRTKKWHVSHWIKSLLSKNLRPIMEILDVVPDNEADFWEREYIQNFRERGFKLTNGTDGGDGVRGRFGEQNPFFGKTHKPESNEKNRLSHLGKKQSLESIAARAAKNSGKKRTPEFCALMREIRLGEKNPMFGKPATNLGKPHSPQTCDKLSVAAAARFERESRVRDEKGRWL